MKRSVKYKTGKYEHFGSVHYHDKTLSMTVYRDGTGFLDVPGINFYTKAMSHKSRIRALEKIVRIATKALKTLEQIEDPKIYFPKD